MCRSDGAYKALHHVLFANDVWPRWGFFLFPRCVSCKGLSGEQYKIIAQQLMILPNRVILKFFHRVMMCGPALKLIPVLFYEGECNSPLRFSS